MGNQQDSGNRGQSDQQQQAGQGGNRQQGSGGIQRQDSQQSGGQQNRQQQSGAGGGGRQQEQSREGNKSARSDDRVSQGDLDAGEIGNDESKGAGQGNRERGGNDQKR